MELLCDVVGVWLVRPFEVLPSSDPSALTCELQGTLTKVLTCKVVLRKLTSRSVINLSLSPVAYFNLEHFY